MVGIVGVMGWGVSGRGIVMGRGGVCGVMMYSLVMMILMMLWMMMAVDTTSKVGRMMMKVMIVHYHFIHSFEIPIVGFLSKKFKLYGLVDGKTEE